MSRFIEMFKGDNQVPLGDICNIEKGATITRNDVLPGEVPVVAGGQEPSCYHNVANREAGAITVSASGAYAGYINFWNCPIFASDCNTIISKDDEKTDQTFVYFGLRAMQKQIYGLQKGGAQPHVYGKDLQKFMFPCPSYAKQIEFSKMAKQSDKSVFDDFKSRFIEMFGNPVTNDKKWETQPIQEIAPEKPSNDLQEGNVWLLNLDMIEPNTGRVIEKVYVDSKDLLSVSPFDEGNVLFSKLRPYLNKVVIPNGKGYATTELLPLRPNGKKLNKTFFSYLLRSDEFVTYANSIATGTKMPRMPLTSLRKFECILPPMEQQQQFVAIAEQSDKSVQVKQIKNTTTIK